MPTFKKGDSVRVYDWCWRAGTHGSIVSYEEGFFEVKVDSADAIKPILFRADELELLPAAPQERAE